MLRSCPVGVSRASTKCRVLAVRRFSLLDSFDNVTGPAPPPSPPRLLQSTFISLSLYVQSNVGAATVVAEVVVVVRIVMLRAEVLAVFYTVLQHESDCILFCSCLRPPPFLPFLCVCVCCSWNEK